MKEPKTFNTFWSDPHAVKYVSKGFRHSILNGAIEWVKYWEEQGNIKVLFIDWNAKPPHIKFNKPIHESKEAPIISFIIYYFGIIEEDLK